MKKLITVSAVLATAFALDLVTLPKAEATCGGAVTCNARTIGYWGNKHGRKDFKCTDNFWGNLQYMAYLNLKNADGSDFEPCFGSEACYEGFKAWLRTANSTNMAYMLSAQLAATEMNLREQYVPGHALVFAPGTNYADPITGYVKLENLVSEANWALGVDGYTPPGDANRAYQEALKNALDLANNNQFVGGCL